MFVVLKHFQHKQAVILTQQRSKLTLTPCNCIKIKSKLLNTFLQVQAVFVEIIRIARDYIGWFEHHFQHNKQVILCQERVYSD